MSVLVARLVIFTGAPYWLGLGLAGMCGTFLRVAMIELHLPGVAGICGELLGFVGG